MDWQTVGAEIGLPHHILTWLHLSVQAFLFGWGLTSYLGGVPLEFYYSNLIIFGATTFFAIVGVIWTSGWCRSSRRVSFENANAVGAAQTSDKLYYVCSFFINFGILAFVVFVWSLDVGMARDPTATFTNLTDADLANATTIKLYDYARETYLITMIQASAHFIIFSLVILVVGANEKSYLALSAFAATLKGNAANPEGIPQRTVVQNGVAVPALAALSKKPLSAAAASLKGTQRT